MSLTPGNIAFKFVEKYGTLGKVFAPPSEKASFPEREVRFPNKQHPRKKYHRTRPAKDSFPWKIYILRLQLFTSMFRSCLYSVLVIKLLNRLSYWARHLYKLLLNISMWRKFFKIAVPILNYYLNLSKNIRMISIENVLLRTVSILLTPSSQALIKDLTVVCRTGKGEARITCRPAQNHECYSCSFLLIRCLSEKMNFLL